MSEQRAPQCVHIKDDGERCGSKSRINPNNGLCLWHDPLRQKKATELRRRGALSTKRTRQNEKRTRTVEATEAPPMPKTLNEVADWLAWLAVAVVTGQVDARTAKEATTAVDKLRLALKDRDRLDERLKDAHDKLTAALERRERKR